MVMVQGDIISQDMYFRSIHVCNDYAHALVHGQHKNIHHNTMVTAYCIPKKVNESTTVYDR